MKSVAARKWEGILQQNFSQMCGIFRGLGKKLGYYGKYGTKWLLSMNGMQKFAVRALDFAVLVIHNYLKLVLQEGS